LPHSDTGSSEFDEFIRRHSAPHILITLPHLLHATLHDCMGSQFPLHILGMHCFIATAVATKEFQLDLGIFLSKNTRLQRDWTQPILAISIWHPFEPTEHPNRANSASRGSIPSSSGDDSVSSWAHGGDEEMMINSTLVDRSIQ
jgi:hypothetical protein